MENAKQWPAPAAQSMATTFGGNITRNYVAPGEFALRSLAWSMEWPLAKRNVSGVASSHFSLPPNSAVEVAGSPISYHPVAAGDLVVFSDRDRVYVYNLQTGRPAWKHSSKEVAPGQVYQQAATANSGTALGVARFTATVHGTYLFARLGSQVTSWPETSLDDNNRSALVILDLAQQGKLIAVVPPENDRWSFEGPPVCDGSRFYVAMRYNDVRPQAHVACYELVATTGIAGTAYIPRLRWRRMVCSAESPARGSVQEITHNMLTLADGTLYLNTNLGAVASLSADDGRIRWLSTYPRATGVHLLRDLNPCVHHRGTLYVAPTDSPHIFAFDAMTGLVRWATVPSAMADVVHLLGVAEGNLIASGKQLWWLDAETGKVVTSFPATMETGQAQPRGRGLLQGDVVVWPTRNLLYVFNQKQTPSNDANSLPAMPRDPIRLADYDDRISGGNLVDAGEYTLLATADKLWVFGPRLKKTE
jgi:outer membrane protein assembly factor BamB